MFKKLNAFALALVLLGFVNELKCYNFVGSFAEDHRQNQQIRSEQNKALEVKIN
jgi:hypothetical protein